MLAQERRIGKILDSLLHRRRRDMAPEVETVRYSLPGALLERRFDFLHGYQHEKLIQQEVENALHHLQEEGVSSPLHVVLFGSAARKELRTLIDDSEDSSDIDLLVILSDKDMRQLDERQQKERTLSRSRSSLGVTSYLAKPESISGLLEQTEIVLYSLTDIEKQLNSNRQDTPTRF